VYQLFHLISDAKGFVANISSLPVFTNKNVGSDKVRSPSFPFQRANIMIILKCKRLNAAVYASSVCASIANREDFSKFLFLIF
jgi:hypothetical protein